MQRRRIICCFAMAAAISACAANSLRPGEGVANDHAGNVSFVQRGGGNAYGFGGSSQFFTPIGLTLLAWDIPSSISVVEGLRLNLGVGRFEKTYGVDVGAFSRSGDFADSNITIVGNDGNWEVVQHRAGDTKGMLWLHRKVGLAIVVR